ncbi:hypothetical protein GGR52DRAFT_574214 [Hypoxylon sp. FL1284]|nr:hypothetical protein GGR52DRAFT_574214 [Hypoxylon sp. FL1284]
MRKSRSSHIKCDCGEKTHKCAHLKQTVEGHKDSCCCNHGGRCTCSHKKEPSLDTVPESDSDVDCHYTKSKTSTRRRRTNTTHSEPILSFDENGHRKPQPRHTKASQKSGPYTVNRGSTMHRTSSASSLGTKSVDRSSRITGSTSPDRESRISKSAQASPSIECNSSLQHLNGQLPPLDLSSIRYSDYPPSFELFSGITDYEPPLFSASLSETPVDWGQYDGLELKRENLTPSSFQTQSLMGFDLAGSTEPTLTSNSGDVSETEDFMPKFDGESQFDAFRGNSASGYLGVQQQQQQNMLTADDMNVIDYNQFKGSAAADKLFSNQSSFDDSNSVFPIVEDENSYWSMNNFADGITHSPDPVASGLWDTS